MDRKQYSQARIRVTYADNSVVGLCSIRCLTIELKAQNKKKIKVVEVADFSTRKLINAENAYWVVGGAVKGVMTSTPKWAFADKAAAEKFVSKHDGTLSSYEKVLAMAEKER
jgi:nitrous oxide reductase accessory protein NosL